MTPPGPAAPIGEHCPHCGADLVTGTEDFAGTPTHTDDVDVERVELVPGQMVQVSICPTPGCAGPDTGAQV